MQRSRLVVCALLAAAAIVWSCAPLQENESNGSTATSESPLVGNASVMINGRYSHTLTKLANGKVLAVGGWDASSNKLASAEIFDPATNTWTATGSLATARAGHAAVLLSDGTVLVTGGVGASTVLSSAERYDPATGIWSPAPSMSRATYDHTATRLNDGRVLVAGGCAAVNGAEIFNPATNSWSPTGAPVLSRCMHHATLLNDGRVLITAGTSMQTDSNRVEAYNPATGTFTELAPAAQYKNNSHEVKLADGKVMLVDNYSQTACEIYDPVANTWTSIAPPHDQRVMERLVLMGDGSVLVAGNDTSSVERYAGGAWSIVGHLSGERKEPEAVLLDDGRVLLAGGYRVVWTPCGGTPGCFNGKSVPVTTSETYTNTLSQLATYNATLKAPACMSTQSECDSAGLLNGNGLAAGPELNQPNTIGGTCADGSAGYGGDEQVQAIRVRSADGATIKSGSPVIVQVEVFASISSYASDSLDLWRATDANNPSWQLIATLPLNQQIGGLQDLSTTLGGLPPGALQAIRASFRRGGSAIPCTTGAYDDHDDLAFAVAPGAPDTTPPTVAFTSPAPGAVVGLNVPVSATASDNVGVNRVEFWNGGTLLFTDTAAPYGFSWTATTNGSTTLTAKAYDDAGNVSTATVSFTVDRTPPAVSITAPVNGSTLSGTVTVSANATDNVAIARVDFYVGSTLIGSDTTAPYGVTWNTVGWDGSRTLNATAYDTVNNAATAFPVTVTVNNGPPPGTATYDSALRTASCRGTGSSCDSGTLFTGRGPLGPEPNASNTINASCADGAYGTYHSDESLDRLRVYSTDGLPMQAGHQVTIQATVWAWAGYTYDALDLYYASNATNPVWLYLGTIVPSAAGQQTMTTTYTLPAGSMQAVRGQFRFQGGAGTLCNNSGYDDRDDLAFAVSP